MYRLNRQTMNMQEGSAMPLVQVEKVHVVQLSSAFIA